MGDATIIDFTGRDAVTDTLTDFLRKKAFFGHGDRRDDHLRSASPAMKRLAARAFENSPLLSTARHSRGAIYPRISGGPLSPVS